jgi:hypothetical protein
MFESPYNKFAPEGSIPIISKSIVKSKLSNKFNQIMELAANYGSDMKIENDDIEEQNNQNDYYTSNELSKYII